MKFRILPACGLIHASSTLQSEVCVPCQYAQRRTKHRPNHRCIAVQKTKLSKLKVRARACVCVVLKEILHRRPRFM